MTSPLAMRPRVRRSRLFMGGAAAVVFVLAITNSAASVGFPIGQQLERVVNALVTVHLLVTFVILLAVVLVGARRDAESGTTAAGRPTVIDQRGQQLGAATTSPGVLAPVGLALVAVDWILWLIFALPTVLHALITRENGYLYGVLPFVVFGPMLVIGTVFAVVGFHRGGSRTNRIVSLLGAGLALLDMAVAVALGLLCAVGVLR